LYVPHIVERPTQWVRAWKPEVPGIHEVFHARFVDHAYPAHTHDAWTVFTLDEGSIAYDLERRQRGVEGSKVTLLPPHVVHDGRPAASAGYRKRVLYVGTEVLGEHLIGPAVDEPDLLDPSLVRGFRSLHRALDVPGDAFEAESIFALVASRLAEHLGERREADDDSPPGISIAEELRDLLDARLSVGIPLAEAGRILEVSPAHLVRSFTHRFGISPHRYLIGRRIEAARRQLLDGQPVARVAADVGFHDQAHLARHFKRHVGTTPGAYR
jgi:AraC-like DNA-binding protein